MRKPLQGRTLGLHDHVPIDTMLLDGPLEMPYFFPENVLPLRLISFNHALSFRGDRETTGVHFYIDDYQFERVWNTPAKYLDLLGRFLCVCSPDFSIFSDFPLAVQHWNHYRSQALAQYWQNHGIRVIPSLNWADETSYQFSFSGVPAEGTVSVSTVGALHCASSYRYWQAGMAAAVQRLRPKRILAYGDFLEFDAGGAEVVWYRSEHLARLRAQPKKQRSRMNARTEFLMAHPEVVFRVADTMGIPQNDLDDFQQEVLYQSLKYRCSFDPAKSDISTYSYRFAKFVALKVLKKTEHFLPLGDVGEMDDEMDSWDERF